MKNVATLISSVLSHPSAQGKTSEELGTDIANILHNHRVLASSVDPLEMLINSNDIVDMVLDYDSFLFDELGVNDEDQKRLAHILDEDIDLVTDAIAAVEPEFNFDNSLLQEEVSAEINRVNYEVLRLLVKENL